MRGLASLYFFIVLIGYNLWSTTSASFLLATLFGGYSIFITNVQPYKEKYMSVIDSLIFANLALLSATLIGSNFYASPFYQIVKEVFTPIPALGLFSFVIYKLLKKPLKPVFSQIKYKLPQVRSWLLLICCKGHNSDGVRDEEQEGTNNDSDILDLIVNPELYVQEDQAA